MVSMTCGLMGLTDFPISKFKFATAISVHQILSMRSFSTETAGKFKNPDIDAELHTPYFFQMFVYNKSLQEPTEPNSWKLKAAEIHGI